VNDNQFSERRSNRPVRPDVGPRRREPPLRIAGRCVRPFHVMIYLCHVGLGISLSLLAKTFDRDRATLRYICARMEDLRDDTGFDRMLSAAEGGLRQMALVATSQVQP